MPQDKGAALNLHFGHGTCHGKDVVLDAETLFGCQEDAAEWWDVGLWIWQCEERVPINVVSQHAHQDVQLHMVQTFIQFQKLIQIFSGAKLHDDRGVEWYLQCKQEMVFLSVIHAQL